MMNTKRIAGLLFAAITFLTVIGPVKSVSAAWTMGGGFVDAANWQLSSLTFQPDEIGDALSEGLLQDIAGNSDANRGLTILNSYIASQSLGTFFDQDASDDNHEWVKNDCGTSKMRHQEGEYKLVNLFVNFPNIGCKDVLDKDLILPNGAKDGPVTLLFAFSDADTIVRVDGVGGSFELSDPTNYPGTYFSASQGNVEVRSGNIGIYQKNGDVIEFTIDGPLPWSVRPYDASNPYVPPAGGGGPTGGGGNNAPLPPSCSNSSDGGPIRWILCPTLAVIDKTISRLENALQDLLYVRDPDSQIDSTASARLKTSWGRFRNIALIILVPIMLVMIIGTAVGASAFDAYTIRRAMPRFLIAIVFISVSWYITSFLINLTNVVGTGIQGLMLSPFPELSGDTTLADLLTIGESIEISVISGGIFAGMAIAGSITIGVLISFAAVIAMSLFIGWFLLTIRQMLIYALVLLAPLAILSWIFPNNDKLWKVWWGTFSALLFMFPILMMVIAASKIFAYVIATI